MSIELLNLLKAGGDNNPLFVDDVFSSYIYTGNGASQSIVNEIDLAGNGGLVWIKARNQINDHHIFDTFRGVNKRLMANVVNAETTVANSVTAFNNNGFSINNAAIVNTNLINYISWTFKKSPKFLDVITYTGNGGSKVIPHNLGTVPGFIIVKNISNTGHWICAHIGSAWGSNIILSSTSPEFASTQFIWPGPDSVNFYVGADLSVNTNLDNYIAYVFAHDSSANGIIQCGEYTGNGLADNSNIINLGWEPQFLLIKRVTGGVGDWLIEDISRHGLSYDTISSTLLKPNLADTEAGAGRYFTARADGFSHNNNNSNANESGSNYLYVAIRRSNKPPINSSQVYKGVAWSGNSSGLARDISTSPITPDVFFVQQNRASGGNQLWYDRARSTNYLEPGTIASETAYNGALFCKIPLGMQLGVGNLNTTGINYFGWAFKRMTKFLDVVQYTWTGSPSAKLHNLKITPEMMFIKRRSGTEGGTAGLWTVFHKDLTTPANREIILNTTAAEATSSAWNSVLPTSTNFTVNNALVNFSGDLYSAYLFASLAGISKVGKYTGNGGSQTINCEFSSGAKFILIKRTDAVGDWFVWDTERGIIAGNDPHFSFNTAAAEVTTDDSIDPDTSGFIVNQLAATNINVTSATYIFLAIA